MKVEISFPGCLSLEVVKTVLLNTMKSNEGIRLPVKKKKKSEFFYSFLNGVLISSLNCHFETMLECHDLFILKSLKAICDIYFVLRDCGSSWDFQLLFVNYIDLPLEPQSKLLMLYLISSAPGDFLWVLL